MNIIQKVDKIYQSLLSALLPDNSDLDYH